MVKKVIHIADKDLPTYLIQARKKYINSVTFNNNNLPDLLYTTKHTIDSEIVNMMQGGKLVIYVDGKYVTLFKNGIWANIIE